MKKTVAVASFVIAALIGGSFTMAASPIPPAIDKLIKALSETGVDGKPAQRVARVTYDPSSFSDIRTEGTHRLGVFLPANAIIEKGWYRVETGFTGDTGFGVAFECEDSENITGEISLSAVTAGSMVITKADGTVANMVEDIGSNCEVSAVVKDAAVSSGKMIMFLRYLEHD